MFIFEPLSHRNAEELQRVGRTASIQRDTRAVETVARLGGFQPADLADFLRGQGGEGLVCFETGVWPGDEDELPLVGYVLYKSIWKHRVFEIARVWSTGGYRSDLGLELIRRVVEEAKNVGSTCRAAAADEATANLFRAYPWTCISVVSGPTPSAYPIARFVFPAPTATALRSYEAGQNPTRKPADSVRADR